MRKSNWLILLLVLGCQEDKELLITKWKKKNAGVHTQVRLFASEPKSFQCFDDIFTVETLKLEIKDLESGYQDGAKLQGKWKHLDFSKLPIPQASFLNKYGNEIGDLSKTDAIDYSSCHDVPCLFNKIYQQEDGVAGYLHYLWYLKFGHMLAADNKLFKVNDKYYEIPRVPGTYDYKSGLTITSRTFPLSAFLLTKEELYGFWWLSKILDQNFKSIGFMKEIQMIPRGERLESFEDSSFCGLAHSQGYITLTSACLKPDSFGHSRTFFKTVTHELSHQIDLSRGELRMAKYSSQSKEYLDITGFVQVESLDEKGSPRSTWTAPANFTAVSPYAKSNPLENFAETLAYYRHDGDKTKAAVTDDQYKYFSRSFFGGSNFEMVTLLSTWIKGYSTQISSEMLDAVSNCYKNPVTSANLSTYLKSSDLTESIPKNLLSCLSAKAEASKNTFISHVMLNEPDACGIVENRSNHAKIDDLVKKEIVLAIDRHIQMLRRDPEVLGRLSKFYEELGELKIAFKAYVECYGEDKGCYSGQVKSLLENQGRDLNFSSEVLNELIQTYLTAHTAKNAEDIVLDAYQTFLKSRQKIVYDDASSLWKECRSLPAVDKEAPKGSAFVTTSGYMVSSLFNCLNEFHEKTVKDLLSKMTVDGFDVENPKEEIIMEKMLKEHLNAELLVLFEKESKLELARIEKSFKENEMSLRGRLENDLAWATDAKNFLTACRTEVLKDQKDLPYFYLNKDVYKPLAQNFCIELIRGEKFRAWFGTQRPIYEKQISDLLAEKLFDALLDGKSACFIKFPKIPLLEKVYASKREDCFFKNWESLEDRLVQSHLKDASVVQLGLKATDLKAMLIKRRDEIRKKLISEN